MIDEESMAKSKHQMKKPDYPKPCYYCQHGTITPKHTTTTFKCSLCEIPLCKPTLTEIAGTNILRMVYQKEGTQKRDKPLS